MNYLPITGIILRNIYLIRNYMNRLLFVFYWPTLDILMWGFVGKYMQTIQGNDNIQMIFLLSILLWSAFARIGMEVFQSLVEELWSNNIINVFASPLKLSEWIVGTILFVILIFIILMSFLILLVGLFYDVSILSLIKNFIIFSPSLLLAAISIGFLALSIIIYSGIRFIEIAYVIMWTFMPFSGVFYPIETLPLWAQKISYCLPMTYTFIGMRAYVQNQIDSTPYLIKSVILSLVYGTIFLLLFFYMFNKSKDKGLSRLTE
ncbi:MAG: ABC transporter permease [Candidatus Babeliales bacterium]|nr:ABC transporter permease [Candidatus Babeliales bacterium]